MRILLFLLALTAATAASAVDYRVDARVWIDGTLRGEPSVVVESASEATIEMVQGDTGWRMTVLVEPPMEHEGAGVDAIWIRVGISELVDGEWEYLTDSMLGVQAGSTASFSVVDPGVETATTDNARLFVELSASPIEASTEESTEASTEAAIEESAAESEEMRD